MNFLGIGNTKKDTDVMVIKGPALDAYGHLTVEEVEARRTYSEISTTSFQAGGGGGGGGRQTIRLRYASCTQRGYYPDEPLKKNQDAITTTQNFAGEDGDLFFAIHDGHGSEGHDCAVYARDNLPKLLTKYLRQDRAKLFKERQQGCGLGDGSGSRGELVPFNPKLWPMLDEDSYERVSRRAHLDCNTNMIRDMNRCKLSGTTSISAAFHDGRFIISNVGDSRAVLGYRELTTITDDTNDSYEEEKKEIEIRPAGKLIAVPLSVDHTPWRKDERRRIKKAGGRILTIDQIEGCKPIPPETMHNDEEGEEEEEDDDDEFGDRILGTNDDTVDIAGDPPRVWLPNEPLPGTAYTRSLGDGIAQTVGVNAEPEMVTKDITFMMGDAANDGGVEMDEVLVLASDGVFEFLTNQEVIDICDGAGCPMDACRKIMDQSYAKWVEYENRTDDISVIVIWMDTL